MKKLYYFTSAVYNYTTFFVDEKAKIIGTIDENDGLYTYGLYRDEFMSFIPEFFGGKMIQLYIKDDLNRGEEYYDYKEAFKLQNYKKKILQEIKKLDNKKSKK